MIYTNATTGFVQGGTPSTPKRICPLIPNGALLLRVQLPYAGIELLPLTSAAARIGSHDIGLQSFAGGMTINRQDSLWFVTQTLFCSLARHCEVLFCSAVETPRSGVGRVGVRRVLDRLVGGAVQPLVVARLKQ